MSDPEIPVPALWLHCQPGSDVEIPITRLREETTIGRHADCGLRIPSQYVSRHHARVFFEQGYWWVEDLKSSNGVFINKEKAQRARLVNACTLQLGQRVTFKVFIDRVTREIPSQPERSSL